MRLIVPAHPRRASVNAFWLTMSVLIGLGSSLIVSVDVVSRLGMTVLGAGVIVVCARLRYREAEQLYRLWARASRLYARITRRVVLRLCHSAIFVAVGVCGSRLRLAPLRAGESLWAPRSALAVDSYRSQFEDGDGRSSAGPWATTAAWAIRSGNAWALVLVPFLALVSALEVDDSQHFPRGIYTLF